MRCRPFFLLSSFFLYLFYTSTLSLSYSRFRERTAPNVGGTLSSASHFHLIKTPSGINQVPPPNGALKPFDGTIQTKKRLGYPNRFFVVSTKKHRSESERRLVREMGLEPTRQRHTHLKRACLPIPALSHIFLTCLISQLLYYSTADIYIHQ